ncbi:hypothetical protein P885DRAFT_40368 [Corynascus similis CBS 632.67]
MRPPSLLPLLLPLGGLSGLAQARINWDIFEYGVVPTFKWSRPFPDDGSNPGGFHVHCRHSKTFSAKMYKLRDLTEPPPTGLAPWKIGIEDFLRKRDYVGSWDGVDHKDLDREIVVMDWLDVPFEVRAWIEEQQSDTSEANDKKWLFGVFRKPQSEGEKVLRTVQPPKTAGTGAGTAATTATQQQQEGSEATKEGGDDDKGDSGPEVADKDKIVVFPAGAIYEILPLWVANGSGCERDFNNLAKYKSRAIDHAVLAWPIDHTKPQRDLGKRDITFKIEGMSVTESEDGKRARLMWEKMHRTIKRNERKQQREQRQKAKKELEKERVRDEL